MPYWSGMRSRTTTASAIKADENSEQPKDGKKRAAGDLRGIKISDTTFAPIMIPTRFCAGKPRAIQHNRAIGAMCSWTTAML